jgi:predicted MFS family arabinose efflux permease
MYIAGNPLSQLAIHEYVLTTPQVLLCIGSFITVFAMFMTSLCNEYYQFFLVEGFLLGIGIALLFCPAMATVPLHFKANRGLALGIVVSGSSLGGVIWPIALKGLLVEVGFGWTVRIAGFMMLALTGLACLTIRPPVNSAESSSQQPQRRSIEVSVFKNPTLILMSVSLSFIFMGLFSPFFYVTPYTVSLGLDVNMAFYMISILNAASLFGRILPGILADWYGPVNIFNCATACSFIIIFCWTRATSIAGIAVFSLTYGFFSGAVVSLMGVCAIQSAAPAQYGSAIGFAMSILSIG